MTVRIGRQTCALRPVGRIQLSVWRCWLDRDTCGPATYPVFVRCPRGLESDRSLMTMSLSQTGSLSCWTAMATMLLWPTMAKLRSGSFVPALLKYENLPDIKGSAVPRSLRETPIRSAAFLVSMTGDAVSQGDIARLFDVYLQKPFSREAFMQVIEDARCSSDANTRQAA